MFYFQTNELHFTAEFLGRVRFVGAVASLAGVACYNFLLFTLMLVGTGGFRHLEKL